MNEKEKNRSARIEKKIGYTFGDQSLFKTALTHNSYAVEQGLERHFSNQRLEFLGDALLDAIIGEALFLRFPRSKEGELSKMRAGLVCEKTLATIGKELGLNQSLLLGQGIRQNEKAIPASILADAVEALVGAVYLDGGYNVAKKSTLCLFRSIIEETFHQWEDRDYKSQLQEFYQNLGPTRIVYRVVKEEGPAHDKEFSVVVFINDEPHGSGQGKNKKSAQQQAAKEALARRKK